MEGDKRFSARVAEGHDPAPAIVGALRATEQFVAATGLEESTAARLLVCVEELVSNALRHGSAGGRTAEVDLQLRCRPEGVELVLSDNGAAFDPTSRREFTGPDRQTGGGVGLELVRRWAREMVYARTRGRNELRLLLGLS